MGTSARPRPVRLAEKLLAIRTGLGLSQSEMLRRLELSEEDLNESSENKRMVLGLLIMASPFLAVIMLVVIASNWRSEPNYSYPTESSYSTNSNPAINHNSNLNGLTNTTSNTSANSNYKRTRPSYDPNAPLLPRPKSDIEPLYNEVQRLKEQEGMTDEEAVNKILRDAGEIP